MKILGMLHMASGLVLTLLVLRATHGTWADFGEIALTAAGLNALTILIAYFLFRPRTAAPGPLPDRRIDQVFLVGTYLAGIGGGCYFYYT